MARLKYQGIGLGVMLLAVFYQWWLKDILFIFYGLGHTPQPISNFPYKCRRLEHKSLEACSDLWLDEKQRVLYATCTGIEAREAWDPNLSRFNYSGRRPSGSKLMAIYIDQPLRNGLFKMHPIQATKYGSAPGDNKLDLAGFDVEVLDDGATHRFWLINQRPPYNPNGTLLDARTHGGANTTIDVYEHTTSSTRMTFLASGFSPRLHAASSIAFMGANNFVVVNARSPLQSQTPFQPPLQSSIQSSLYSRLRSLRRSLDPFLNIPSSLIYHDDWFDTYRPTPHPLPMPGHIARGPDDRIYIPSLVSRGIQIFELREYGFLSHVHTLRTPVPISGLSVDSRGAFWGVGRSRYDATGGRSSSSVYKIDIVKEKLPIRYVVSRVLEDGGREYLRGAEVVRFDVRTRRLFFGGSYMPFISVCEEQ